MSIMDMFRSQPVAATPAASTTPAAPATPAVAAPVEPAATPAPLDGFSTLWETAPTDQNAAPATVFAGLDASKVFEAAKSANFAGAISQDHLQAIAAGGEGAVAAFQAAMNSATQAVFAQSTIATTKLIEKAIAETNAANLAALPGLVKRHAAADTLNTENPAFSNPAALPIINALQAQLALKHPSATATQLASMAKEYLKEFAGVVNPAAPVTPSKPEAGEVDWSRFLQ